jgi:antitoxin (DNA-binding transcriptional repressor) of toxin-antitoxin stability system
MDVPVKQAEGRLDELLDRAAAGEDIVLIREGKPPVRLVVPGAVVSLPRFRPEVIDEITRRAASEALPGPDAAHSQDFLYDEFGLPN